MIIDNRLTSNLFPPFFSFTRTVWAETGDFRDNGHTTMANVANSLDINQLHFQSSTNIRNNKNRDRKNDGMYIIHIFHSKIQSQTPKQCSRLRYLNNLKFRAAW